MIQTHQTTNAQTALERLIATDSVGDLLREGLGLAWQDGSQPSDVTIDRVWPMRDGGFSFEWSFATGGEKRGTLFGTLGVSASQDGVAASLEPVLTPYGIRNVYAMLPECGLLVHSPDVDPRLPHLSQCLDSHAMAGELADAGLTSNGRPARGAVRVECRVLSYRPGRRAAVQYDLCDESGSSHRVLGKTYRDDRGAELLGRHAQLNDRLAIAVGDRVSVPQPLGYLEDLHMAVYAWAPGRPVDDETAATQAHTRRSADVLAALHGLAFDDLATYTPRDEWDIVNRWQRALCLLDEATAAQSQPLVEALRAARARLEPTTPCTLHRDFYESQLLIDPAGTTLLDIDTLCSGDRCADLGNLLAHQYLLFLRRTNRGPSFPGVIRCLLQRYEAGVESVSRVNLRFYLAAALFRVGAVHAVRTATRPFVPDLWRLADGLMDIGQAHDKTEPGHRAGSAAPNLDLILGALR